MKQVKKKISHSHKSIGLNEFIVGKYCISFIMFLFLLSDLRKINISAFLIQYCINISYGKSYDIYSLMCCTSICVEQSFILFQTTLLGRKLKGYFSKKMFSSVRFQIGFQSRYTNLILYRIVISFEFRMNKNA